MIMCESLKGHSSRFHKEIRPLRSLMHENALETGRATLHKQAPDTARHDCNNRFFEGFHRWIVMTALVPSQRWFGGREPTELSC